jgi:hypothetical protein
MRSTIYTLRCLQMSKNEPKPLPSPKVPLVGCARTACERLR